MSNWSIKQKNRVFFFIVFFCGNLANAQIVVEAKITPISDSILPFESYYGKISLTFNRIKRKCSIFEIESELTKNIIATYSLDTSEIKLNCDIGKAFFLNSKLSSRDKLIKAKDTLEFIFCVPIIHPEIFLNNIGEKLTISINPSLLLKFQRNSSINQSLVVTSNVLNEEDKRFIDYLKNKQPSSYQIFPKLNYIYDLDIDLLTKINKEHNLSTYDLKTRCFLAKLLNIQSSRIYSETVKDKAFYDIGIFALEKFERSEGFLLSEKLNSEFMKLNAYCTDNDRNNIINSEDYYLVVVNRSLAESIKENNKQNQNF